LRLKSYLPQLFVLLIFLLGSDAYAQSDRVAGKLRGRVVDADNGSPLYGANVIILPAELSKGAATNEDGDYLIPNVLAGTYDVRVTYIGYGSKLTTGLSVFPGQTTVMNAELKVEAIEGQAVEVVAEAKRAIIAVRSPVAQREVKGEEIKRMPVSDFTEVLANSAGAIETEAGNSRGLHLRGGRAGEVAFFVDGINTNDPVSQGVGIEIDNNAIEQIVISTGGFSAEYGEAMSGAVNIITKEGRSSRHAGNIEYESDSWGSKLDPDADFGYHKTRANLSGPVPLTKRNLTYFISGTYENTADRNPKPFPQQHNSVLAPNGTAKLVYSPDNSAFKVTVQGSFSREDELLYKHNISYGDWLRSYYGRENGHSRLSLKVQNSISKNTAWEFLAYYFNTYSNFSSGEGQNYRDFHYLSSRLDWMNKNDGAIGNGWYDPETREWNAIVDARNIPLIKDFYRLPDGSALSSASYEDQAFYYYYANRGYYDLAAGSWNSPQSEAEALNQRYHDAAYWYIPSDLEPTSAWYNPSDNGVYMRDFDIDLYSDYLFAHPDSQTVNDLWGYNGDLHSGFSWDRDLFNVFTYGPGSPWFHKQDTKHYASEFHLNSQVNMYNEIKFGGLLKFSDLRYLDMQFLNRNPYFDSYKYHPTTAAVWLEDRFEYEDLIFHIGARTDYFHPHAKALWDPDEFDPGSDGLTDEKESGYDAILNPDPHGDNYSVTANPGGTEGDGNVDYKNAKPKYQISPRFGISFAVSDQTAMFANYGHFFMMPELGEIYQNLYTDLTSGYPLVGNPDIEPQKTTAYEVGLKHSVTPDLAIEVSAFYKDVENLLATRTYNTIFEGNVATVTFQEVEDFAKIKGMDFKFTFRNFYGFTGEVNYSYLNAKGTGSSSREYYYMYIYEADRPLPAKEYPLEFDITHSLKANINYFIPAQKGPKIFGLHPLSNFNANLQAIINSGAPYTPVDIYDKPLELGSKRMPSGTRFDLRVEKYLPLFGRTVLSFYADVRNLFAKLNIAQVYQYTGLADDPGRNPVFESSRYARYIGQTDPMTGRRITSAEDAYAVHMNLRKAYYTNPYNYSIPRIIRLGVSLRF